MSEVKKELMHFIKQDAPWVVFTAVVCHALFCIAVVWKYWDAVFRETTVSLTLAGTDPGMER
jgi:hypothetical protein